jgi:hypothetical protein
MSIESVEPPVPEQMAQRSRCLPSGTMRIFEECKARMISRLNELISLIFARFLFYDSLNLDIIRSEDPHINPSDDEEITSFEHQ